MLFRSRDRLLAPTTQRLLCGQAIRTCARLASSACWRLNPTRVPPPTQKSPRPSRRELRSKVGQGYDTVVLSTDHKNKLLSVRLKSSSGRMFQFSRPKPTDCRRRPPALGRHANSILVSLCSLVVFALCVRLRCLTLGIFCQKILLYHLGQCVDRFLCVAAFRFQYQLRSLSCSQR